MISAALDTLVTRVEVAQMTASPAPAHTMKLHAGKTLNGKLTSHPQASSVTEWIIFDHSDLMEILIQHATG